MKTCLTPWIAFWIAFGGFEVGAVESFSRNYGAEMSVSAEVQADFFSRYPDLQDERELVTAAARSLAAEGSVQPDTATGAELLATRTRALLERRTPAEWNRKAVSLFPELGVAGSEFNALFLRHYNELKQTSPQFLEEPSWPVLLARRCADELRPAAPAVAVATPPKSVVAATVVPANPPPARTKAWVSWVSFLLLLAITVQPARWLFRCRTAFAGSGRPITLWQQALRPAAWTYLVMGAIALIRTFLANADQRPIDRFGITLLVSVLGGAVFAVPAFAVALGGFWWWRRRRPAEPTGSGGPYQTAPASSGDAHGK